MGYGCAQHPVAKTKEIYRVRVLLRQEDLNMWVTAFADVAELIMCVSVEEFSAFNDEGKKRIAWGMQGMKCNMTIAKTVGEMYTNYTFESMQFAGYLPWTLTRTRLVSLLGGTCIATDNACKLVINLIFNTIIYRIYIQYGYL